MFATFAVLNEERSTVLNCVHPENMDAMLVTFSVLNVERSRPVNDVQPANRLFMSCTWSVLRLLRLSMRTSDSKLRNQ